MGKPYIRQVEVIGLVEKLGTVILFDDLEDLFKWRGAGTGTDWVVEKSTTIAYDGNASLHLQTKATTPTAGDAVTADRFTFVPYGRKISLECLFRFETLTNEDVVSFELYWYDGTALHLAALQYLPPEMKWQYFASDGTWKDIPGGDQNLGQAKFHRVKMIVDFEHNKYVSLQCDDKVMDISDLSFQVTPSTVRGTFKALFKVTAETAARAEAYFDNIFVKEE